MHVSRSIRHLQLLLRIRLAVWRDDVGRIVRSVWLLLRLQVIKWSDVRDSLLWHRVAVCSDVGKVWLRILVWRGDVGHAARSMRLHLWFLVVRDVIRSARFLLCFRYQCTHELVVAQNSAI
jgi:hypothetical protein